MGQYQNMSPSSCHVFACGTVGALVGLYLEAYHLFSGGYGGQQGQGDGQQNGNFGYGERVSPLLPHFELRT